jgi:sigma-B regulation protein RsbU (phosphoserine phosphatase)
VSAASHILLTDSPPEIFATLFFGILDLRDGMLRYCNAGHTTGCIRRLDGSVARLPANSPLAGAVPVDTWEQSEERMGPDDLLLLYTDGLTEARRNGEFFGEQRLLDLLAKGAQATPGELVGDVMDDVMAFTGRRLRDDLAIVSLKRVEE